MNRFGKFFIVLLVIGLNACSSSPNYFKPISPVGDDGVLYVYRPELEGVFIQPISHSYPDLILDGESIGVLKFNTHRAKRIKSGEHNLKVTGLTEKANWELRDKDLTFKIKPGEIKYIKINIQYGERGGFDGRIFYITPVSPENAIYEIRDTDETIGF